MSALPLTIGVTGLNATDNPGPGVAVLRSLRASALPGETFVGLTYDALDPGLYAAGLADASFLLAYPSSGIPASLARLREIHAKVQFDVIVPTLDAELPLFISMAPQLREAGIAVLLPSEAQLAVRRKAELASLGKAAGFDVPASAIVASAAELAGVHARIPYPFFVKGPFYGATLVWTYEEAVSAFHRALAAWGGPVIVQSMVQGEEVNAVGVGDGEGGLWGAVAMKKLALTDKGKGWAGVTIEDARLLDLAEKFVSHTRWRGPFEVEVIRSRASDYQVIEINPRFPAWVHLATGAGVNLPRAVVDLALGRRPARPAPYAVGKMFVRIFVDQIVELATFASLATRGEVIGVRSTSL
jgi:carbamoyl-phosphate synthase large subunit